MRILIFIAALTFIYEQSNAQTKSNQIIKDFGIVYDLENVVKPTNTDQEYKIVIDLKTPLKDPEKVNRGLDNVARMLNLHAAGGISAENLNVAVAVHGGATPIIFDNKAYAQKYGVENPNIELINQLNSAGVELYVCSQSMIARKYKLDKVYSEVDIALSMLTVVAEKMHNGYQLMVFQ